MIKTTRKRIELYGGSVAIIALLTLWVLLNEIFMHQKPFHLDALAHISALRTAIINYLAPVCAGVLGGMLLRDRLPIAHVGAAYYGVLMLSVLIISAVKAAYSGSFILSSFGMMPEISLLMALSILPMLAINSRRNNLWFSFCLSAFTLLFMQGFYFLLPTESLGAYWDVVFIVPMLAPLLIGIVTAIEQKRKQSVTEHMPISGKGAMMLVIAIAVAATALMIISKLFSGSVTSESPLTIKLAEMPEHLWKWFTYAFTALLIGFLCNRTITLRQCTAMYLLMLAGNQGISHILALATGKSVHFFWIWDMLLYTAPLMIFSISLTLKHSRFRTIALVCGAIVGFSPVFFSLMSKVPNISSKLLLFPAVLAAILLVVVIVRGEGYEKQNKDATSC